ncbi:hypothetical protein [Paenibacillus sp. oral taxon 786]|uniref:hypothetical protein n=1 Tax=Paenibacillus sp. oral taxon 786 TaxID=652715 RepID=UPI000565A571|nr:hypothetical protein [Paenibacillus sp. oral taxon 786]
MIGLNLYEFIIYNEVYTIVAIIRDDPFDLLRTSAVNLHFFVFQGTKNAIEIVRTNNGLASSPHRSFGFPFRAQVLTKALHMSVFDINRAVLGQNDKVRSLLPKADLAAGEIAAEPAVPGRAAETAPREEAALKAEAARRAEVARKAEITRMETILMMDTTRMAEKGTLQLVAETARKAERAALELAAETREEPADSPLGV